MLYILLALLAVPSVYARSGGSGAVFQDEVRPDAYTHSQKHTGANADPNDKDFAPAPDGGSERLVRGYVREPFHFSGAEDMRSVISASYHSVLSEVLAMDSSGGEGENANRRRKLAGQDIIRFMKLVLNPDRVPLSPEEEAAVDAALMPFLRKQGLWVPGKEPEEQLPAHLEFFYNWSTTDFLNTVSRSLTAVRTKAKAAAKQRRLELEQEEREKLAQAQRQQAAVDQGQAAFDPLAEALANAAWEQAGAAAFHDEL